MSSTRLAAAASLLAAMTLTGANVAFGKAVVAEFPIYVFVLFRFVISCLALLPLASAEEGPRLRHMTRAELRDPDKTYNKLDRTGLQNLTPKLDWEGYFKATGHPEVTQINVAVPEFFTGLEKLGGSTDAATFGAYLQWNVLRTAAPALPRAPSA